MVSNHGDRCCPLNGVVGPLINGQTSWLINGGDPSYSLSGGPSSKHGSGSLKFGRWLGRRIDSGRFPNDMKSRFGE